MEGSSLIANVKSYTQKESADWAPWPWPSCCKPCNPELLIKRAKRAAVLTLVGHSTGARILMPVHSLKFDNGREWDCINGFRDGGGPA